MTNHDAVRVLRVVTLASRTGRYGGPTDTAIRQAQLLSDSNLTVRVLAGSVRGDEATDVRLETLSVRQYVPGAGYTGLFSMALALRTIRRVREADGVHVSFARELIPLWATMVAILLRKPCVLQPHGMLTARTSRAHGFVDRVIRPLARRATAIVALTDIEERELRTWFGPGRVPAFFVVGNPSPAVVSSDRWRREALFAARLHARKRALNFVEAASIASSQEDCIDYVVAGPDQGDGPAVALAAATLPNCTYVGGLSPDGVLDLLAGTGVFVLPSVDEPWGNVVATAVKGSIPVVMTESAALASELLAANAALVVPDDDAQAIRDAVRSILDNRVDFIARIDRDAISRRFGNDGIARELLDAYAFAGVNCRSGKEQVVANG